MDAVQNYRADAPTSTRLLAGRGLLSEVVNLRPSPDGGLRSVRAPVIFHANASPDGVPLAIGYAELHQGTRKVLLSVDVGGVKVWRWHERLWHTLIGPVGSGADIETILASPETKFWAPSFIPTNTGVVIVLPGNISYFYDGHIVAQLGYTEAPQSPTGIGPASSSDSGQISTDPRVSGTNDTAYVSDGLQGWEHSSHPMYGGGRLGTVDVDVGRQNDKATTAPGDAATIAGGQLLPARYRAKAQFVDRWGNLSPLSAPSNDITFDAQQAFSVPHRLTPIAFLPRWTRADLARKRVLWSAIPLGRRGTVARIIYRTKDLINSGSGAYWELPLDAVGVASAVGTLPDNITRVYPDNIPDGWLTSPPIEVEPVPRFSIAAQAFNRLWVGNIQDDQGAIMASMPGLYGTFPRGSRRFPSRTGDPITGMLAVDEGLLVLTKSSTHLYRATDDGKDFIAQTLSSTVGCVAPHSLAMHADGGAVWLGEDGFYGLVNGQVVFLWQEHRTLATEHVTSRLSRATAIYDPTTREYRCWVPVRGSVNPNRCYTFDGAAWRWREDTSARGACVIGKDVYVAGEDMQSAAGEDYFVLDRGRFVGLPTVIQTAWVTNPDPTRRSYRRLSVRLRETYMGDPTSRGDEANITLSIQRDYRVEVVGTKTTKLTPSVASGPRASAWHIDNADQMFMRERRWFWVHLDFGAMSAETIRLRLESDRPVEILDMILEETHKEPGAGRAFA
jgi:hypothetical protein